MAQTMNLPDTLTDEQMNQLSASSNLPDTLTDEQINQLTAVPQTPKRSIFKSVAGFVGDVSGVKGVYDVLKEGVTTKKPLTQLIPRAAGSAAKIGLNLATLGGAGSVGSLGARTFGSAGLGAGFATAEAVEKGRLPSVGELATGAAVGGALPLAGKALGVAKQGLTEILPRSLIRGVLPGQTSTELSEHVLKNTNLGSTRMILNNSKNNVKQLSNQIDDTLRETVVPTTFNMEALDFKDAVNVPKLFKSVAQRYGKTGGAGTVSSAEVKKQILKVIPEARGMLNKENLTLNEIWDVAKKLNTALGSKFFEARHAPFSKQIAGAFNEFSRDLIKKAAPGTVPLFDELSKEIALRNALQTSVKKFGKLSLYDALGAMTGFVTGGPVGAGVAIGLEKAARSPAVGIGVAKGFSKLGRVAIPETAKRVFKTGILSSQNKVF